VIECRGCKRPIVFATTTTGKKIPLEKQTVYEIEWREHPDETRGREAVALKIEREVFISHFLTCSAANRFSGGGK
jgi:hypothetical protein